MYGSGQPEPSALTASAAFDGVRTGHHHSKYTICAHLIKGFQATAHLCPAMTCTWGWPEPYKYGVCTVYLAGKSSNLRS